MGTNEWRERAACFKSDPEVFFDERRHEEARVICVGCRVRKECFQYADETDPRSGVWGGLTVKERLRRYPRKKVGDRIKISYQDL